MTADLKTDFGRRARGDIYLRKHNSTKSKNVPKCNKEIDSCKNKYTWAVTCESTESGDSENEE